MAPHALDTRTRFHVAPGSGLRRKPAEHDPFIFSRAATGAEIRLHKDGLLRARCRARGLAPSRLFVWVDPLSFPLNTRLEIEFPGDEGRERAACRLSAIVTRRSSRGIELRLEPNPVNNK
jgi:hypothetical protein